MRLRLQLLDDARQPTNGATSMFGSQALETAIGLALLFFVLATAASAITEAISSKLEKRHGELERALIALLDSDSLSAGDKAQLPAAVTKVVRRATGKTRAAYVSARSFADAVTELVAKGENIGVLRDRLDVLAREVRGDLTSVKAGLESSFDEAMAQAQAAYKKWVTLILFGIGLTLAITLNASTINVTQDLWKDSSVRDAVVEAAADADEYPSDCKKGGDVGKAACSVEKVSSVHLPMGWTDDQRFDSHDAAGALVWWWLVHLFGWLLTAVLIMLGAPFWFDLLSRLSNLRAGASKRPKPAADDEASSTFLLGITGVGPTAGYGRRPVRHGDEPAAGAQENPDEPGVPEDDRAGAAAAGEIDWLATALNLETPVPH